MLLDWKCPINFCPQTSRVLYSLRHLWGLNTAVFTYCKCIWQTVANNLHFHIILILSCILSLATTKHVLTNKFCSLVKVTVRPVINAKLGLVSSKDFCFTKKLKQLSLRSQEEKKIDNKRKALVLRVLLHLTLTLY